jgi:hypothetical protein
VILAIIALANPEWTMLAAIATILAGGCLLFAAAHWASEFEGEMRGAMSAEFLGGAAGVVLGVLAILGIAPEVLISAAVIVFGASLALGSAGCGFYAASTSGSFAAGQPAEATRFHSNESFSSAGAQALIGAAAAVLGIIALVGQAEFATTLNVVALLVIGAGLLLTSPPVTRGMMSVFR